MNSIVQLALITAIVELYDSTVADSVDVATTDVSTTDVSTTDDSTVADSVDVATTGVKAAAHFFEQKIIQSKSPVSSPLLTLSLTITPTL